MKNFTDFLYLRYLKFLNPLLDVRGGEGHRALKVLVLPCRVTEACTLAALLCLWCPEPSLAVCLNPGCKLASPTMCPRNWPIISAGPWVIPGPLAPPWSHHTPKRYLAAHALSLGLACCQLFMHSICNPALLQNFWVACLESDVSFVMFSHSSPPTSPEV